MTMTMMMMVVVVVVVVKKKKRRRRRRRIYIWPVESLRRLRGIGEAFRAESHTLGRRRWIDPACQRDHHRDDHHHGDDHDDSWDSYWENYHRPHRFERDVDRLGT